VGLTFFKACSSILTFQPILSVDHQNYSAPVSQSVFLRKYFIYGKPLGRMKTEIKKRIPAHFLRGYSLTREEIILIVCLNIREHFVLQSNAEFVRFLRKYP